MDFGRGLAYIRRDPDWIIKVVLGSIISLVPILNFAATGYVLNTTRNVAQERETPLPDWGQNFGDHFVRGLFGVVIQFIYAIPIIIVGCLYVATIAGTAAATGSNQDGSAIGAGLSLSTLCLMPLMGIASIVCGTLGWIAMTRYAITNDFSASLRIGEVLGEFRNNISAWISVIIMMMIAGFAMGIISIFTCGLGLLLSFYASLAGAHWTAQAYYAAAPPPIEPTGY